MNVAIRADASSAMGSGHLMRCLTLAGVLRERGAQVLFIGHALPQHLAAQVLAQGHRLAALPLASAAGEVAPQSAWPPERQLEDAAACAGLLHEGDFDWLVADHYGLDRLWESRLRGAAARLMVIDDLARAHDCDLLLDPNFHPDPTARYATQLDARAIRLLGPAHALLRPEFARAREGAAPRDGEVLRMLVFMGGMDAGNATGLVLRTIERLARTAPALDVVIGAGHPALAQIGAWCAARANATCHVQTGDMAGLLARADMAVGAGGSATWERCALGVPTLALALADNQRPLLASAARRGAVYAPDGGLPDEAVLAVHLQALLDNSALRSHLSREALSLVDGQGTQRVASAMLGAAVTVRPAVAADCSDIHAWRNAPAVREVSLDSREITFDAHQRWFEQVLGAPDRSLLVGELAGRSVGVVRFDIGAAQAEVSIYLAPPRAGQGLGTGLLRAAEAWLADAHPGVTTLLAQTLPANHASQRLFERCGYNRDTIAFYKRISTP